MKRDLEIKEPTRFPSWKEACKKLTIAEIYTMAETTYKLQIATEGGVIDE